MDVLHIANELLRLSKDEADNGNGELMTNMKLQKMLYYQQGFHLAVFGTPLFSDSIEAWMYGPVVPKVYHKYECHQANGLLPEDDIPAVEFASSEERNLFMDVYDTYSQYSAIGLMKMTHEEDPWKNSPVGRGNIIPLQSMTDFFKTRLA